MQVIKTYQSGKYIPSSNRTPNTHVPSIWFIDLYAVFEEPAVHADIYITFAFGSDYSLGITF